MQVHRNKDGSISLKLADFGLAMEVKEPIFTVCGTPTYVAPEILSEIGKYCNVYIRHTVYLFIHAQYCSLNLRLAVDFINLNWFCLQAMAWRQTCGLQESLRIFCCVVSHPFEVLIETRQNCLSLLKQENMSSLVHIGTTSHHVCVT